ncbi:MAG TPA: lytic transglycosylase domain-containing protein [Dongiaceae bacterium]|nr:lytic transglycosylase domain-containing protein [Dongiaceae bacterium]
MGQRTIRTTAFATFAVALAFGFCAASAQAQIAKVASNDGRMLFVNAEPPTVAKASKGQGISLLPSKRQEIYLPSQTSFSGKSRPGMELDRDGAEKLVREAAERHRVDPALVRAVIQTESNWNPGAVSRKGAIGLMQLIPTTAQRFGVNDLYSPQQNVDAGVRYLKTLLERYNGNLDLALAAYNAGEGAVDRAHGVPSFRETRNYVQRVQDVYFRPGSGRLDGAFMNPRAIRKSTDPSGRTIFTND